MLSGKARPAREPAHGSMTALPPMEACPLSCSAACALIISVGLQIKQSWLPCVSEQLWVMHAGRQAKFNRKRCSPSSSAASAQAVPASPALPGRGPLKTPAPSTRPAADTASARPRTRSCSSSSDACQRRHPDTLPQCQAIRLPVLQHCGYLHVAVKALLSNACHFTTQQCCSASD